MVGFAESIARRCGGGRVKKTILGLVILASVFLAGCPVSDLHPLYKSSDNVSEPLLVGKWVPPDSGDKGFIEFQEGSGSSYTMVVQDPDSKDADHYDVHLVRLGGNLFADLKFSNRSRGDANVDMPIGVIAVHVVIEMTVTKDDLGWATMEEDPLKIFLKNSAPPEKHTVGNLEYDSDASLVLADTETLRGYVVAHATDGFPQTEHWHRVK
jgi:hypothetical protein